MEHETVINKVNMFSNTPINYICNNEDVIKYLKKHDAKIQYILYGWTIVFYCTIVAILMYSYQMFIVIFVFNYACILSMNINEYDK